MAAVDLNCIGPQCDRIAQYRGICNVCYASCITAVNEGTTTWRELELAGLCVNNNGAMTDAIKQMKKKRESNPDYTFHEQLKAEREKNRELHATVYRLTTEHDAVVAEANTKIDNLLTEVAGFKRNRSELLDRIADLHKVNIEQDKAMQKLQNGLTPELESLKYDLETANSNNQWLRKLKDDAEAILHTIKLHPETRLATNEWLRELLNETKPILLKEGDND